MPTRASASISCVDENMLGSFSPTLKRRCSPSLTKRADACSVRGGEIFYINPPLPLLFQREEQFGAALFQRREQCLLLVKKTTGLTLQRIQQLADDLERNIDP